MKRFFIFLFFFVSCLGFSGEKEGVGGDPLIEEFFHRSQFVLTSFKKGMVERKYASLYESAYKDLRVDITDRELPTTGRVLSDPKRQGKFYVLLDRNKFFKLLTNSSGGDITAFVAHEGLETQGVDFNYEVTRSLKFNEDEYQRWKLENPGLFGGSNSSSSKHSFDALRQIDSLDAIWSGYKYHFIKGGRVISLDEQGVTTSEGQGYALLRAVWSNDQDTFDSVWDWTRRHLQIRKDKAFAWKFNGRVIDENNASDADTDIALALILAHRRFKEDKYSKAALEVLESLWKTSVIEVKGEPYLTAGNWAKEKAPYTIHVGYLAPYAYEVFSRFDYSHPWKRLVITSYKILEEIFEKKHLQLPPERIYLKKDGSFLTTRPDSGKEEIFGYDAVPLFWRLAMDRRWNGRGEKLIVAKALSFFSGEWEKNKSFQERYQLNGTPLSSYENLPLYTSVYALASDLNPALAEQLFKKKVSPLLTQAVDGKALPYYLHNWLWFSRAFTLNLLSPYDEFLAFLRHFDVQGFLDSFPWILFSIMIIFYLLRRYHSLLFGAFLVSATVLSIQYLGWRANQTLNFMEPLGPFISISLWIAEAYGFSTILFLIVQIGLKKAPPRIRPEVPGFAPKVDIFVPIFSEPLEILERTLVGCKNIRYPNFEVFVLDDGHRADVRGLCESLGAHYILGPKKHAKAGNLNNALAKSNGELVLVFDTDHIPVHSFLEETVPYFTDEKVGFVQTPHHFYNEDIFQRAFKTSKRIPNEQDMFNHAIQGGRDSWGGAFFAGSGAVFRRKALKKLGGFKLMSITEDIHTSQHLHAKGWKSVFVDKDLAVGLTAENLSSHTIQRRRWMLGCLQIFMKDNALLCSGLSLRQRLGYFASHYYFLFPIFRVIFFLTPLYYLFFHLHPVFSDVSVLVAHLIPFMVALPLMTNAIIPGWPRFLWGTAYEYSVCFSLFRSMFDLFLPKSLGFKVTPKGITTSKRSFDRVTSGLTLIATAIVLAAIGKGLAEFYYFGIEKDAYFFNLAWASINLFFLLFALLLAWERPQRRVEHRIYVPGTADIHGEGKSISLKITNLSLTGLGFYSLERVGIPKTGKLTLNLHDIAMDVDYELVRKKNKFLKGCSGGIRFMNLSKENEYQILRATFAHPKTWENFHAPRTKSSLPMILAFVTGLLKSLKPERTARVALALLVISASSQASLTESWYLSRGRSNMEIKNYRAAIEAFESATKINPDNTDTIRSLGLAYEAQGLRDKSIATFDKYLEKNPDDYSIAFKQAQTLGWSRYSYREQDALKYYRQGLSRKNDSRMRIKYADILARKKSTIPEAIDQFRKVLEENPNSKQAHLGLARAYAWNGQRDLAAYHASFAKSEGTSEVKTLQRDLRRGHEPEVEGLAEIIYQPNSTYDLEGFRGGMTGRQDVGAFVTLHEQAGWEYFSGNEFSINGPFVKGEIQYRAGETAQLNGSLGYNSLGGNGSGEILYGAKVKLLNGTQSITPGFERLLIEDSLISYAGKKTKDHVIGGARLYNFYSNFEWKFDPWGLEVRPFLGFITTPSSPNNFRLGLEGKPSITFLSLGNWSFKASYRATLLHYGQDHSQSIYRDIEPYGDAYFSPRFYLEQTPLLGIRWQASDRQSLGVEGGPTFQMVHQFQQPDAFQIGGIANASYEFQLSNRLTVWMNCGFSQIASSYSRLAAAGGMGYLF